MKFVVSQPMFLPWIGIFDQVRMADCFIHYDDVQLPVGRSFMHRVQLPTPKGMIWLSAPVDHGTKAGSINQACFVAQDDWRKQHLETIRHLYSKSRNFKPMFDLIKEIYAFPDRNIATFNSNAIELISSRIGLQAVFKTASDLAITGKSTERLINLCVHEGATSYLTGHGAANYLDHLAFERNGVEVQYVSYAFKSWPQVSHPFTPFASVIDLMASIGFSEISSFMHSSAVSWREFLVERERAEFSTYRIVI